MTLPPESKFTGCLIGQCLGDALGCVMEGASPSECRRYVGDYLRRGRAGEIGRPPFPFGQYTDDSQLAREMLQSYVACGRFDPTDYARRIAAIFAENRIVGRGVTTEAAARRLIAGIPWDRAGTPPPAAGNGTAMRAGPVGLMFFDDEDGLLDASRDQAKITHADPRCAAGAVAIAGAVALVLSGDPAEPTPFLRRLAGWAGRFDGGFADALRRLEVWMVMPPEAAVRPISRAGLQPGYTDSWAGISPFVIGSVLWSLYSFLRSPDDYWATVCTAIAVGGDVDTTAAMAGAIAGDRLGLDALPPDPARRVNDQGTWDFDALVGLARRAREIKGGT